MSLVDVRISVNQLVSLFGFNLMGAGHLNKRYCNELDVNLYDGQHFCFDKGIPLQDFIKLFDQSIEQGFCEVKNNWEYYYNQDYQ